MKPSSLFYLKVVYYDRLTDFWEQLALYTREKLDTYQASLDEARDTPKLLTIAAQLLGTHVPALEKLEQLAVFYEIALAKKTDRMLDEHSVILKLQRLKERCSGHLETFIRCYLEHDPRTPAYLEPYAGYDDPAGIQQFIHAYELFLHRYKPSAHPTSTTESALRSLKITSTHSSPESSSSASPSLSAPSLSRPIAVPTSASATPVTTTPCSTPAGTPVSALCSTSASTPWLTLLHSPTSLSWTSQPIHPDRYVRPPTREQVLQDMMAEDMAAERRISRQPVRYRPPDFSTGDASAVVTSTSTSQDTKRTDERLYEVFL